MAYQAEGSVEAARELESKIAKLYRAFKTQFKRWAIFNLFTFPFIAMFYVPYNLFWLQYTQLQLIKWVLTSSVLAAIFNLFYRPYVAFVTRFLDKHVPNKPKDLKAEPMPTQSEGDSK